MKNQLNFESSFDDGDEWDLELVELLKKYRLPATFYLTSHCSMVSEIPKLLKAGFEIGGHTATHPPDIKLLNDSMLEWEIGSNKKLLEMDTPDKITKFCYPRGRFDDRVIEVLKRHHYKSARTTTVLDISKPTDPFRTNTTIHVYPRDEYFGEHWVEVAKKYAELAAQQGGVFHLWGHSWEINKLGEWENLDKFFNWLRDNYDVESI